MKPLDIKLSKQNIVDDVAAELNLYGRTLELSATSDGKESINLQELANYIRTPDDNETKPIIARSMQEAWNRVKETCQRYYVHGRYYDDNRLEAIVHEEKTDGLLDLLTSDNYIHLEMAKNTTYHFRFNFTGCLEDSTEAKCSFMLDDEVVHTFDLDSNTKIIEFDYFSKTAEPRSLRLEADENTFREHISKDAYYTITWNRYGEYNLQLSMPDNFNIGVTSVITTYSHRFIVDSVVSAVLKNQRQDGYTKYLTTAEDTRLKLLRSLQARNSFGRVQHDFM